MHFLCMDLCPLLGLPVSGASRQGGHQVGPREVTCDLRYRFTFAYVLSPISCFQIKWFLSLRFQIQMFPGRIRVELLAGGRRELEGSIWKGQL